MNQELSNFLQFAVLRNENEFTITHVIMNTYQMPTDIKGKVKKDNVMVDTMWAIDGSNKDFGNQYDLVKSIPYSEYIQ